MEEWRQYHQDGKAGVEAGLFGREEFSLIWCGKFPFLVWKGGLIVRGNWLASRAENPCRARRDLNEGHWLASQLHLREQSYLKMYISSRTRQIASVGEIASTADISSSCSRGVIKFSDMLELPNEEVKAKDLPKCQQKHYLCCSSCQNRKWGPRNYYGLQSVSILSQPPPFPSAHFLL